MADDGNNEEKIQQFMTVTGVDETRARFYMESSAGQLEVALASFYENDSEPDVIVQDTTATTTTGSDEPTTNESNANASKITTSKKQRGRKSARFGGLVHTLHSSSDEEEEHEDEGQAFYAGGSEHSGQQVLGPPKRDIVADMFRSVREHGVEILDSGPSSSRSAFGGTGYKLGQTDDDSVAVPAPNSAFSAAPPKQVTLKLWRNGFSLNNGEIRLYSDPSNKDFLDSIRRGEIPQELRQGNSEIHLSMEDHRMEEFRQEGECRGSRRAFSGQGHVLGNPTPRVVGAPLEEDSAVNEASARQMLEVNPNEPVTNLQIRLADGSRLLGQFNHEHTVGQVRSFILTARPQYQTRPFSLLTAYPSKELDDAQTLQDAGILNAAIMQKLL